MVMNGMNKDELSEAHESFSDDIALSNLDVEIGNSASMILPPIELVIIMLELPSLKLFISYYL